MTRTQQRTLAFCNRVRAALGKQPRKTLAKGSLGDPKSCPIARTIYEYGITADCRSLRAQHREDRLVLSGAGFDVKADGRITLPGYAQQFISTFDAGRYPELIA